MRFPLHKQKKSQPLPRRRMQTAEAARPADRSSSSPYMFRRNRTLTGSLVSEIKSATEPTSQLKSARVQTHELRRHRRKLAWLLVGVCGLAIGVGVILNELIVVPRVVLAAGNGTVNTNRYAEGVNRYIEQNPIARLRFMMKTEELANYLRQNGMPEVAGIDTHIAAADHFGEKEISLTLRKPVVMWQSNDTKLYVDAEGVAFRHNAYAQPGVAVVDESGIQARNDQVLASERFLGFIGLIIGAMDEQGYEVDQIVLPVNTTRQVQIRVKGVPYPMKLSIDRGAGEQAEDIARAIKHLSARTYTPQYIDVRVEGKAYYR